MKLPKLIGNLTPNAAVGFADARALQVTGAPFLTAKGPGYTTRLKNGFVEVRTHETSTETAKPYLWGMGLIAGAEAFHLAKPGKKGKQLQYLPTDGAQISDVSGHAVWVAPGRILTLRTVLGATPLDGKYWAVLMKPASALETLPGADDQAARSISMRATLSDYFPQTIFATGAKPSGQYAWGYSFIEYRVASTGGVSYHGASTPSSKPTVTLGLASVAKASVAGVVDLPHETDRVHFGGRAFCVGPGKLLCLTTTATQATGDAIGSGTYFKPQVEPFLSTSEDHGATWSRTPASALTALWAARRQIGLSPGHPAYDVDDTPRYINGQLKAVAEACTFTYVGNGRSIALFAGLGTNYDVSGGGTEYRSIRCFRYEAGALTPLTWPGDTLYAPHTYYRVGVGGNASSWLFASVSACFGPGCFAAYQRHEADAGRPYRLNFTHDAGASWAVSGYVPWLRTVQPVVLSPYISPEQPGRILFVADPFPSGAAGVWSTTGAFSSFRFVGTLSKSVFTTNYAVPFLKRTKLNLALPDEFGPP